MLKKWEIQPGMGGEILGGIGQDVRTRQLEAKEYLGDIPHWRFRLEVIEAGVVEWKKMGAAGGGDEPKDSGILMPGEVVQGLSGAVGLIARAPESGGELVYDFPGETRKPWQIRQGMHITGLVSVETGEPNVDLQIFMKA